jgi:DnaJ-class molecular chaperone
MGFSQAAFTAESLRARYRQLMMRHHPDADPTGLERCKDVNIAYSLLISEAAAQA